MKKKVLSVVLSFTLLSCLIPSTAMALKPGGKPESVPTPKEITDYDPNISIDKTGAPGERPVWMVSHRCNTNVLTAGRSRIKEENSQVQQAINARCNGVEVDIRWSQKWRLHTGGHLVLCHDPGITKSYTETLEQFLEMNLWQQHKINVIVYDIKEPDECIDKLIDITHKYVRANPEKYRGLNFIYSVEDLKTAKKHFPRIVNKLSQNEFIEISTDLAESAANVEGFYKSLNYDRCWYGCGCDSYAPYATKWGWRDKYPTIKKNCTDAVKIANGDKAAIKQVDCWSINHNDYTLEMLKDWKIDCLLVGGFITKDRITIKNSKIGLYGNISVLEWLLYKHNKENPNNRVYLATESDNPAIHIKR